MTADADNSRPPGLLAAGAAEPWQLPRGRHRLPFQVVAENQSRRLLTGAGRALAETGYAPLTIKHIIEEAGVSRATFYANFDDKRDCVLAAHRDAFERLLALILRACATEREWPRKVRAALAVSLAFMSAEPGAAALLTLSPVAADRAIGQQLRDCNAHLATLLREGRRHTPFGPLLPDLVEEGLIGGVLSLLGPRVHSGDACALTDLEPQLLQFLLAPYLGLQEARRIACGEDGTAAALSLRP